MFLIEIAAPAGALTATDRSTFTSAVLAALVGDLGEEGAPEETMRRARTMTHVGFRELAAWHTGDGPWTPRAVPPLWITLTVPEAWRDEVAQHTIRFMRRAVRRLDRDHGWERSAGDLWVNVTGVPDGCIGLGGRPSTADDVVLHMTEEFRSKVDAGDLALPDGVVVDPMCGMKVRLAPGAITLEHDGETKGFCALSCRAAYAREHGLPVPSR